MYYPAPQNVKLRLEWTTWHKISSTHDSHTSTQKRMRQINEKIYGLSKKKHSKTPSVGLNGTTVLMKKALSASPNKSVTYKLTKDSSHSYTESQEVSSSRLFPHLQKPVVPQPQASTKEKKIDDVKNIEEKFQDVMNEEELFGPKKSYKLNLKILPVIQNKSKIKDFKLEGKKQIALYKSFDLKREIGTPSPWRGFSIDRSVPLETKKMNHSIAVSTDN